jgi:hypothetical protein
MKSKETGSFANLILKDLLIPNVTNGEEDYDRHNMHWQQTRRFAEDTKHRKGLIKWVKYVVSIWLFLVLFVVTFNLFFRFNLSDSVLITLLATTTVNILGLAYIVLKGLFQLRDTD